MPFVCSLNLFFAMDEIGSRLNNGHSCKINLLQTKPVPNRISNPEPDTQPQTTIFLDARVQIELDLDSPGPYRIYPARGVARAILNKMAFYPAPGCCNSIRKSGKGMLKIKAQLLK